MSCDAPLTRPCVLAVPFLQLVQEKHLSLKQLKFFVIDECDKVLEKHGKPNCTVSPCCSLAACCQVTGMCAPECAGCALPRQCSWHRSTDHVQQSSIAHNLGTTSLLQAPLMQQARLAWYTDLCLSCVPICDVAADMRGDVQAIFKETPHDKQVMMFSATLAKEIRGVCKKFMNKVRENWKQDKLTTAGPHSRAPVAVANPSSSSSSRASMQSCSEANQPAAPAEHHKGAMVQRYSCCLGHPKALQWTVLLALLGCTSATAAGSRGCWVKLLVGVFT